MSLIASKDVLEKEVKEGRFKRSEVNSLEGGKGRIIIYKDTSTHCDARIGESGYLLLLPGATIGRHSHKIDLETLIVRSGKVEINDEEYTTDDICYCMRGEFHDCKNLTHDEAIVEFVTRQ